MHSPLNQVFCYAYYERKKQNNAYNTPVARKAVPMQLSFTTLLIIHTFLLLQLYLIQELKLLNLNVAVQTMGHP